MAQAVFDDHPVEQYLRESGDIPELMPGGNVEFSKEPSHDHYRTPILHQYLLRVLRPLLNAVSHTLEATGLRNHSPALEFSEKFKYIVISSPLLSTSLASPIPNRAATPTTPGHYEPNMPPSHSTTSTVASPPASIAASLWVPFVVLLVPVALAQGYYISGFLILAVAKIFFELLPSLSDSLASNGRDESYWMTLESLKMLVSANNIWDNVVGESLRILEDDERIHVSPMSQAPSLRIALSSSLHTTQTQCDNVRQLLVALTSPTLLSQISEMYAPPSPPTTHTSLSPQSARTRPLSLGPFPAHFSKPAEGTGDAYSRARTRPSSAPLAFPISNVSTWADSHLPPTTVASRRQKRRPTISTIVLQEHLPTSPAPNAQGSTSAPPTAPPTPSQPLSNPPLIEFPPTDPDAREEPFGKLALNLHQKRRVTRSLLSEGSSPFRPSSIVASTHVPLSTSIGSRFTTLNAAASPVPLSPSNMHLVLHGALSAKRFACAHLLALRFHDLQPGCSSDIQPDDNANADDEDESYWENVRSVIALLTSTLQDASARLDEAIADAVRSTKEGTSSSSASPEPSLKPLLLAPQSFAPGPSHMSRFTAHVDAILAALDDAREHLQASVASLRDAPPAALESYERLRRELGLALRECERGRGTLLELMHRRSGHPHDHDPQEREPEDTQHDEQHLSSDESDKTLFSVDDQLSAARNEHERRTHESEAPAHEHDDASAHLIMTATSQHLPPPGIEQVFESLSGPAQSFTRERSKFTREERIRIAKARRESGITPALTVVESDQPLLRQESWGPGGEVVQELKDVIWKVGEQRRKMTERSSSPEHRVIDQFSD